MPQEDYDASGQSTESQYSKIREKEQTEKLTAAESELTTALLNLHSTISSVLVDNQLMYHQIIEKKLQNQSFEVIEAIIKQTKTKIDDIFLLPIIAILKKR